MLRRPKPHDFETSFCKVIIRFAAAAKRTQGSAGCHRNDLLDRIELVTFLIA